VRQIHRGHAAPGQLALEPVAVAECLGQSRIYLGHAVIVAMAVAEASTYGVPASTQTMRLTFRDATPDDVPAIAGLQNAAAGALTARFGPGPWSTLVTERGATLALRHARVRVGRSGKRILTVLRLARAYFTPVPRPLYLTGMAVSVAHQGQGLGRLATEDARTVALAWPADAIRLDAFDAGAGAGTFYLKCGYRERGHVTYRGTPLAYYELLLGPGMVAGR
jgi:GNAT superfamily N-acetyltransferase